ncbi:MAG: Hsp33 family molecular chaperone HslO [Nevskiales bacterium]
MDFPAGHGADRLWRFVFEDTPVRGSLVQLGSGWRDLLVHRHYPPPLQRLLGEALAAGPLLASQLKFDGQLSLQGEGDGWVKLLLVQVTNTLEVRGVVRHAGGREGDGQSVSALLGKGRLGLIIEPSRGQRYQGLVPLAGTRLAESLQAYFERSEQLPSWLLLAADEERAAGLLLQRLPGSDEGEDADEGWKVARLLAQTLSERELLELPGPEVLRRLYHANRLRLFEAEPVAVRCRCSHARTSELLLGLGAIEVRGILKEQGKVEIECGFCGQQYVYYRTEIEQLFAASDAKPESGSRH